MYVCMYVCACGRIKKKIYPLRMSVAEARATEAAGHTRYTSGGRVTCALAASDNISATNLLENASD